MVANVEEKGVTAQELITRMKQFEADRSNWDSLYQDCTDYAMPNNNQVIDRKSPGQTKPDLFDTTAEESNIQLAAGLYSYMFPTDSRAFVLEIENEELSNNDEVKQWLDQVTNTIHKHLVSSNFRESFYEYLKMLGVFGTADIHVEGGKKKPIVFTTHYQADVYISRNSDGDVDTVFRNFDFTARQAAQEFGLENLGEQLTNAFNDVKKRDKKFPFFQAIAPREDYDITKEDGTNMPVASYYVSKTDKNIVSESGYHEMPDMVSIFDKDAREDLGRSPTMKKLPDIKMANHISKCYIKGSEKMVDPPILTPDDGSVWPLATQPGGQIHYRAGGDKPDWFEFKGNLAHMEKFIERTQETIKAGFFLNLFDPLIDRQNMTATEVMARIEQQLRFLTPIIGRLQSGLFNPMITRIIGILGRKNLLPAQPEALVDVEYSVMYLGRLALAMKTLETEGFTRTIEQFRPLAEANIFDWLDNLDTDRAFRDSSRNNGVPAPWLKDLARVKKERDERDLAAKQQAAIEAAPELAKAYKQASGAPEEGSPAEGVLANVA
jgi:hypothetical protein